MSNSKEHQKWCKNKLDIIVFTDNQDLSQSLVEQLREHYKRNVSKSVAHRLDMNLCTVRNWFYKDTGLKAYDLLKLLDNYDFIREFLGFKKTAINKRITGKKHREEVRKKILQLLSKHPKMTMKELALVLEVSPKSVEWRLFQLVKERKLQRIGATKNGTWVVRR